MLSNMIVLTACFAVGLSHPNIQEERIQTMFHPDHLRELITEVLETSPEPRLHSKVAVELLMLTIATESRMGTYLRQVGGGPALGIIQMEPETERDIWDNFLAYGGKVKDLGKWVNLFEDSFSDTRLGLKANIPYQIAMARIHYWRVREPLPPNTDPHLLAWYWKKYYNTMEGKGTVTKAVLDYKRYVLDVGYGKRVGD